MTSAGSWESRSRFFARLPAWLPPALAVGFVLSRLLTTAYLDNEMAYSLGPMMLTRHGYLAQQPFLSEMAGISIVYNLLTAPVFFVLGSFWGTILCRIAIALFQLWALRRLATTLGLSLWAQVVALVLWLDTEQTLAAGEFILGGAATKPISYAFAFLALDALAREDWRRLPLFAGLAGCFHVLVGGWTIAAIGLALLVARSRELGLRGLMRYGVIAGVLSLPALLPGLLSVGSGDAAVVAEASRVSVRFANPFHQDPSFFLSGGEAIKVALVTALAIGLAFRYFPGAAGRLLPLYLGALALFFASGLVASAVGGEVLLKYYPFRVGDAMIPLAFWLAAAAAFQAWYERRPRLYWLLALPVVLGGYNWAIDRADPVRQFSPGVRGVSEAMLRNEPRLTAYWLRSNAMGWIAKLDGRPDELERLQAWARRETPRDAVFITPPWELEWPIRSERATWVSFKILTAGPGILEWKARLEALHNGPFQSVGFGILTELRESYPRLTAGRLHELTSQWPADYFIALADVEGLALVHREGRYRVYRIPEGS